MHALFSTPWDSKSPTLRELRELREHVNMQKEQVAIAMQVLQNYATLNAFVAAKRITLPRPHPWRLVAKPIIGEINGIPSLRGKTVATNGILVAVETLVGEVFVGHLQWFVRDGAEETDLYDAVDPTEVTATPAKRKRQENVVILED